MLDQEKVAELMERLDRMTDEISRIKRALIAASEGIPFTEAFDDELYMESKQQEDLIYYALMIAIEDLYKIEYCINDRNKKHWAHEVEVQIEIAKKHMMWKTKRLNRNLVNRIEKSLDDIHDDAISRYQDDAKKYSDLLGELGYISAKCPWTLDELMNISIDDLI